MILTLVVLLITLFTGFVCTNDHLWNSCEGLFALVIITCVEVYERCKKKIIDMI